MADKTPTVEELQKQFNTFRSESQSREAALKKERDETHLKFVRSKEELDALKASAGDDGDGKGASQEAAAKAADVKTREEAVAQRERDLAMSDLATKHGVEPAKLQEAINALPTDARSTAMVEQVATNMALTAKVTGLEAKGGEGADGAGDGEKPPPPRGASPTDGGQSPRTFDKGSAGMAQRLEAEKDNPKYKGILSPT